MAAKITNIELIMLSVRNSRSAIIFFVPNLCHVYGRLLNNDHTLTNFIR
ncbi:hypothetical protein [Candidatus Leptofilum sp.]